MAIPRKRKQISEDSNASKQTNARAGQKQMKDFGTATKPQKEPQSQKKRKVVHERDATPQPQPAPQTTKRKRKRQLESLTEEAEDEPKPQRPTRELPRKPLAQTKEIRTPQSQRFKNVFPPSPTQTPSKNAAQLFNRLNIRASSPTLQPANKKQRAYDTPPVTPDTEKTLSFAALPDEVQDIARLYSSLMTAFSLHHANNGGSLSPVNTKVLLPAITAHWRKRNVTLVDIRKLLAVTARGPAAFALEDRGRAGIFLVHTQPSSSSPIRSTSFINETELSSQFDIALSQAWKNWCVSIPEEQQTGRAFLQQLPLADIPKSDTSEKTTVLFSRGQQRLADLRAGQKEAQASLSAERAPIAPTGSSTTAVQSRNASLIDRIFAKQSQLASLPAGPTKAELERKSALQRIPDVARMLELLAAGKPRVSFSLQMVIQHLQQSLRSGISREEAERCLGLMAKEIVPGFVSLIQSGTVNGVVVTKGGRVGFAELNERLADAGA